MTIRRHTSRQAMMAVVALGACGTSVAVEKIPLKNSDAGSKASLEPSSIIRSLRLLNCRCAGSGYYWLLGVVVGDGVAASVAGGARTMFQISIMEDSKISIANSQ